MWLMSRYHCQGPADRKVERRAASWQEGDSHVEAIMSKVQPAARASETEWPHVSSMRAGGWGEGRWEGSERKMVAVMRALVRAMSR